jgi:hypothetical protein
VFSKIEIRISGYGTDCETPGIRARNGVKLPKEGQMSVLGKKTGDHTNLCAAAVNDDSRINSGTGHLGELSVLIDVYFVKVELAVYFGEFGECREDRLQGNKSVVLWNDPIELWHSPWPVLTSPHDSRQHIRCLGRSKKTSRVERWKGEGKRNGTDDLLEVISGSDIGNHFEDVKDDDDGRGDKGQSKRREREGCLVSSLGQRMSHTLYQKVEPSLSHKQARIIKKDCSDQA